MEKSKLNSTTSGLAFVSGFIFSQFLVAFAMIIVIVIGGVFSVSSDKIQTFLNTGVGCLITGFIMDLGLALTFIFFNKNKDNNIIQKTKLSKMLICIFIAILSFLCLYPIVSCFDSLLYKFNIKSSGLTYNLTTPNYFLSIISLCVLPAICEELLFRGLIFKGLKPYSKWFSIIVSAVMFMMFHMSLGQMIYPLLMGILFACIMHKENNIIYCIVVHFVNNFISLTLMYFNISLTFNHWTYILFAFALLCAFVCTIIYIISKKIKSENTKKLLPTETRYLTISLIVMAIIWLAINIFNQA